MKVCVAYCNCQPRNDFFVQSQYVRGDVLDFKLVLWLHQLLKMHLLAEDCGT